jgi:HSP20 family molecular chaperone IbpA
MTKNINPALKAAHCQTLVATKSVGLEIPHPCRLPHPKAGSQIRNKAPLTVTPHDKIREYGDANPAFDGKIEGIKNGEDITATYATAASNTSDVNDYEITATLAGSTLDNYDVTYNKGKLTITKAALEVKADDNTKVYGEANPAFTKTITGTKNGDAFSVTYNTAATALSPVGSYTITPFATGAKLTNYTVTYKNGMLGITKRPLKITADNKSKIYGAPLPILTASGDNLVNGDTLQSLGVSVTTTAIAMSPVGNYTINASGANGTNYTVTYAAGTLQITQAALVVTAPNLSKALNAPNPTGSFALPALPAADGITATYSIVGLPTPEDVGTQSSVVVPALSDPLGRLSNYIVTKICGSLTIGYGGNSGILQPINVDGSSVFKQGSTVPAKFKVFDANGNSVGTPGVVASFYLVHVGAVTGAGVNETVLSTTPDTAFRWDASGQQWIFNISTKTLRADTKYSYLITLKDGSTIPFAFGLK